MGEAALNLVPQEEEVGREVATVEDQAKVLKVVDAPSYVAAGELWKAIKAIRAKVAATFDKSIKTAHELHKGLLAKKKEHDGPLDAAERMVKQAMSAYDQEQEAIRKAEEARLAAIARKAEEERLLMEAIAAEEDARANGATKEEAAQEAAAIIAEPVYAPPVVLQKTTPKLQGGPIFQTRWDFEIIDEEKIPRQYMVPDLVKIRQIVTAMKGRTAVPGVRAFEKRV